MADFCLQVKNDLLMFILLNFYIQIRFLSGGPLRMMGKCHLHSALDMKMNFILFSSLPFLESFMFLFENLRVLYTQVAFLFTLAKWERSCMQHRFLREAQVGLQAGVVRLQFVHLEMRALLCVSQGEQGDEMLLSRRRFSWDNS